MLRCSSWPKEGRDCTERLFNSLERFAALCVNPGDPWGNLKPQLSQEPIIDVSKGTKNGAKDIEAVRDSYGDVTKKKRKNKKKANGTNECRPGRMTQTFYYSACTPCRILGFIARKWVASTTQKCHPKYLKWRVAFQMSGAGLHDDDDDDDLPRLPCVIVYKT